MWQNDIVRFTHAGDPDLGCPRIEEVVWSQYPARTTLRYPEDEDPRLLLSLLRLVRADYFVDPRIVPKVLRVAHHEGLDVVKLAEAIGFPVFDSSTCVSDDAENEAEDEDQDEME